MKRGYFTQKALLCNKKFKIFYMHPGLEGGSTLLEGTIAKIFGMYSCYCAIVQRIVQKKFLPE